MKISTAQFQEKYGDVVSQHFAQYTTAHTLRVALAARKPPIIVTDGMLKMWFHGFHSASRPPAVQWGCRRHFLNFRIGLVLGPLAAATLTGGGLAELFPPLRISQGVLAKIVDLDFLIHPVRIDESSPNLQNTSFQNNKNQENNTKSYKS